MIPKTYFVSNMAVIDFNQVAAMTIEKEENVTITTVVYKGNGTASQFRITGPDDLFSAFAAWARSKE